MPKQQSIWCVLHLVATPGSCAKQDGVTTRRGVQILPDCWCYIKFSVNSEYNLGT